MGADRIRREPCPCLSGPPAPRLAKKGRPSSQKAVPCGWCLPPAPGSLPFSGQATRAAHSHGPHHPHLWRATLARVWVFRGGKWQRLLGTRFYLPSQLGDTPKMAEGLHLEGASGISLGQAYHVSEPVISAVMRCLSILAWPATSVTGAAAEMTPPPSSPPPDCPSNKVPPNPCCSLPGQKVSPMGAGL